MNSSDERLQPSSPLSEHSIGYVMPPMVWGATNLSAVASRNTSWLWHGILAPGAVTLLTSQAKAGKTTLISVLLARMKTGGSLAGLPLAIGNAIVVSEENCAHWQRRNQKLEFGEHIGWFCQPFRGKPRLEEWSSFVDGLVDLHSRKPYSLLVIDPLAAFLPGSENNATSMLDALMPLSRLTARDVSVLVSHHPRKNDPKVGQAARGSSALSGYADILIEMRTAGKSKGNDRRRRLWAWSRYAETPRQLVIEWTTDGTDYLSCGTFQDAEFARRWKKLQVVFARAPHKLTRKDILRRWLGKEPPDKITLNRWLEKGVAQGLLRRDGEGNRSKPYRYWLPESEEAWRQDPFSCMLMPELMEQQNDHQAGVQ